MLTEMVQIRQVVHVESDTTTFGRARDQTKTLSKIGRAGPQAPDRSSFV